MGGRVHHSAICARDVEASLRFWRDGIGLEVLMDHSFDGDWPTLFGARSTRLRSVFLGDPAQGDAGVVELVAFADGADETSGPPPAAPAPGFFLLSLYIDVESTLDRLRALGFLRDDGDVRRITMPSPHGPVPMATVRDPDGVLVELVGRPESGGAA